MPDNEKTIIPSGQTFSNINIKQNDGSYISYPIGVNIQNISDDNDKTLPQLLQQKVDKVTGKDLSTNDFTDVLKNKLDGIAAGAAPNVQADWNQSDSSSDAYIKNKPVIPEGGSITVDDALSALSENPVQNKVINTALSAKVDKISGKDLSTNDFTNELKNKLDNIPSTAAANVQADWNETDSTSDAFIKNKPTIPTGSQNTFSTVSVGGQDIVADTTTDTLNLVAGDNIIITPDAATDTITIAALGSSESPSITPSSLAPKMDGTAAAGTSMKYSREDHVHPSDTNKLDVVRGNEYNGRLYFSTGTNTDATTYPRIAFGNIGTSGTSGNLGISYKATSDGDASTLVFVTSAGEINLPPKSHAAADTRYGVGTTGNYGHVKLVNNLTSESYANGQALSANQGKVLNDKITTVDKAVTALTTTVATKVNSSGGTFHDGYLRYGIGQNADGTVYPNAWIGPGGSPSNGTRNMVLWYKADANTDAVYQTLVTSTGQINISPKSHASENNTYGLGTNTLYGHVKLINNLTSSAYTSGEALSAYQGYLLNTNKLNKSGGRLLGGTVSVGIGSNDTASAESTDTWRAEIRHGGAAASGTGTLLVASYTTDASATYQVRALVNSDGTINFPPKSHATAGTDYGAGTVSNYGHVKLINNLSTSEYAVGQALAARQGYVLNQKIVKLVDNPTFYYSFGSNNESATDGFDHTKYPYMYLGTTGVATTTNALVAGINKGTSYKAWEIIDADETFIPSKANRVNGAIYQPRLLFGLGSSSITDDTSPSAISSVLHGGIGSLDSSSSQSHRNLCVYGTNSSGQVLSGTAVELVSETGEVMPTIARKSQVFDHSSQTLTYNGLTIKATKVGGMVQLRISGTLTSQIDTSNKNVVLGSLDTSWRPFETMTINMGFTCNIFGHIIVSSGGNVSIGYTRDPSGSDVTIANGKQLFINTVYTAVVS